MAVGIAAAFLDGNDINHPGILWNSTVAFGWNQCALVVNVQAVAAGGGDSVKFCLDPAAGGADAPGIREGVGEGIASAKADELTDIGFDALWRRCLCNFIKPRIDLGCNAC